MRKKVSVITPCYNEEANVTECYEVVRRIFSEDLPEYDYEHIFTDNSSLDKTVVLLRAIAASDQRVKVIVNSRNFGPLANVFNAVLSASGDAVIPMLAADLQDPPIVIIDFVRLWEKGYKVIYGVRQKRQETWILDLTRKAFYRFLNYWSSFYIPPDAGEFQLLDRIVVNQLCKFEDFYPYVRGLIAYCGFDAIGVPYQWGKRKGGKSKSNLPHMIDLALNGLTSFGSAPLRPCLLAGFFISLASLALAIIYLIVNLINYPHLAPPGIPTLIVALFFFSGVQLFFLGVLGEYIFAIHSQVRHRPLVIERERINFDNDPPI